MKTSYADYEPRPQLPEPSAQTTRPLEQMIEEAVAERNYFPPKKGQERVLEFREPLLRLTETFLRRVFQPPSPALDGSASLSPNFRLGEFASRGEVPTDLQTLVNLTALCWLTLEPLREVTGAPLVIVSGWRTPQHNSAVKGATASRHLVGDAADVRSTRLSPRQLFNIADSAMRAGLIPKGGLHAYSGKHGFLHIDQRGYLARW